MKIGIISDTHGMLKPEVLKALQKADHILHAGDVGGPDIFHTLQRVAPTNAVRGNMDGGAWSKSLPPNDVFELGGKLFYMVHDIYTMDIDPGAANIEVVISGHTHQPEIRHEQGLLVINPGSASHGRHGSPSSMAWLDITKGKLHPRIITFSN